MTKEQYDSLVAGQRVAIGGRHHHRGEYATVLNHVNGVLVVRCDSKPGEPPAWAAECGIISPEEVRLVRTHAMHTGTIADPAAQSSEGKQ